MPQVNPTEITSEESQKQLNAQESLQNNVLNKIKGGDVFKSLDLPSDEEQRHQQQREEETEPEAEQTEEAQSQEDSQSTTEDEGEEEEVIPKSKIQPRIDQLTAQIKQLQQKLSDREATTQAPVDETQRKLDAMSENDLEDTLATVRLQKERSRDDEAKLLELIRLERQIEKTIVTAPQKFVSNQVQEFNRTAERLAAEGEINEANSAKVVEIAKSIYQRYPKMQKAVDGQAMALELAVEHYKALGKVTSGNTNNQNLKAQVNTLKKKTLLDTKSLKSGGDKVALDKLRTNAMTGSMKDKERFAHSDPRFKFDAMIPDHLKGR